MSAEDLGDATPALRNLGREAVERAKPAAAEQFRADARAALEAALHGQGPVALEVALVTAKDMLDGAGCGQRSPHSRSCAARKRREQLHAAPSLVWLQLKAGAHAKP